jgi:predicted ribosomally synthesized peptide with SipW-like signal peptide
MKSIKKKVLLGSLAVCLLALLSSRTLAWFTDSKEVVNEFNIATSEDTEKDDIFSVDVWENTPEGEKDEDGFVYEDILPGDVLKKEANVENTGYYDQYIRVTVTVSDAAAWQAALNTTAVPRLEQIVDGWDRNANVWVDNSSEIVDDKIVYTMYYNGILQGDMESIYDNHKNVVTVFTEVKIPQSLTVEQAVAFKNNFAISVKADAVQTENLGIDRSKGEGAKEAFEVVENN